MQELNKYFQNNNRRHFLKNLGFGIGGLALGSLLDPMGMSGSNSIGPQLQAGPLPLPHFAPKAKRV
ncbi:MAG: twin-arginine translocation signal domain-containing protein, partial [Bacteroidetes bacterium]|nr:twin-arginine translocation signal domain-containing protein [Bacteroidota bacterium]